MGQGSSKCRNPHARALSVAQGCLLALRKGGRGMQVLLSILCFLRLPVGLSICGGVKVCRERVHCTCGYWTLCWHALSGVVLWHFWVVVVVT